MVVRDRSEFQELNRRTVVNDHRYCHTWGGRVRFNQDFLAFECPCKVIHFKGNVREGFDGIRVRGIFIEAHPLDAVRTRLKSRDVNIQPRQVRFAGPDHIGPDKRAPLAPAGCAAPRVTEGPRLKNAAPRVPQIVGVAQA